MKKNRRQNIRITVSPWVANWCRSQMRAGMILSRIIEKAIINYYGLEPPNIKEIKEKIERSKNRRHISEE